MQNEGREQISQIKIVEITDETMQCLKKKWEVKINIMEN